MRPRIVRSPVDICFGTKPSQAAKSRPLAKAAPLPMAATMALAMSGPMPRYRHQLTATLAALRQNLDLLGDMFDTPIKMPLIGAEVFYDPDHAR
jgi:hypothetical protein